MHNADGIHNFDEYYGCCNLYKVDDPYVEISYSEIVDLKTDKDLICLILLDNLLQIFSTANLTDLSRDYARLKFV